jgi:anti-anti-sigma regulatory factor
MSKRKSGKAAGSGRRAGKRADALEAEATEVLTASVAAANPAAPAPIDPATHLKGSFDIHGVEASYREFRGLLASGLPVVIDISGLDAVDTCGVQLLLALEREAQRRSVPLTLRGESAVFDSALHRLGLSDAFATVRRHG